jgi:hypothetical protein
LSLNAAMIQALVEKGMSAQDILDIAKASEVKLDRTAADRQARYREKKRTKRNAVTSRRDPPIEEDHTPGSQISSSDETENDVCVRDADWIEIPDWMPPRPWNGYLAMRQDKKAWPTAYAVELIVSDLRQWRAKGHDPGAILNTSTVSKWTGIFEPKERKSAAFSERETTRQTAERVAARFAAGGDRVVELVPRLGAPGRHDA